MGQFFHATTAPTGGDPSHVRRSRVPAGKCYLSHQGRQQKMRRVIQRTRSLRPTIEQEFRIGVWLRSQPWIDKVDPAYARLSVLHHALCRSEELQLPFGDVLDAQLDTLERETSAALVKLIAGGQA